MFGVTRREMCWMARGPLVPFERSPKLLLGFGDISIIASRLTEGPREAQQLVCLRRGSIQAAVLKLNSKDPEHGRR